MEQQEEKIKSNKRKGQSPILIDLTSEILLRLPEKSVARFRCVSKLWLSISADPYFINLFETRQPRPSLLICFIKDENFYVSSIPQHTRTLRQDSNKAYSSSQPIESYHMKFPGVEYIRRPPTESVHGLICFEGREKLLVWNPSKRQFATLPKPSESLNDLKVFLGLGYDPVEGKHKVICMPLNRSSNLCWVLTLGSAQESWRTVKANQKQYCDFYSSGRCIDGIIYYVASVRETGIWILVVMSFDVRSEKFNMIKLPSNITDHRGRLVTYQGKLACLKECETRLWILEDAKKHEWSGNVYPFPPSGYYNECLPTTFILEDGKILERPSHVRFPPSNRYNESLRTPFLLRGITHTGEFIYVPSMFNKSSYLLFCDPFTKVYRRFDFKEIVEGQQFAARPQPRLYAFPNHIESQISL